MNPKHITTFIIVALMALLVVACGASDGGNQRSDLPAPGPASGGDSPGSSEANAPISTLTGEAISAGATSFQIVPEESEVRFVIDEVLRGQPNTVVGRTNQVAGSISVDPANPTDAQVGVIRVNVRTLATDDDRRNGAIGRWILQTDQFEFAEFAPTAVTGLPASVTLGQPFTLQIAGDLTVRDITHGVTFEATVTPVSETHLEGSAATTIQRTDYNLTIPSVPFVAEVAEDMRLEIDFVAVAD